MLTVVASGFDESVAQVEQYGAAIIQECVAGGYTYVLCDERELEYRLGLADTFEAATYIATVAPKVARIAIVCQPGVIADAQFWENVVVNRGLSARAFVDIEAARKWLADSPGSKP